MSNHPPLVIRSLTQNFGAFTLSEISLTVDAGEYVAIVGPCGAGKTLLLETIAGFHTHRPDMIWLRGTDAAELPPEKRELGFLCQGDTLFPHLSVAANIRFGIRSRGRERRRAAEGRIARLLALLDIEKLAARRDTGNLSGGEGQLVTLARALAPGPRLLLMDEPLRSLDVSFRNLTTRILARLPGETGVAILHVTHDLSEVSGIADRIVALDQGRILQIDSPDALRRAPATRFVAELAGAENLIGSAEELADLVPAERRLALSPAPPGHGKLLVVLDPKRLRVLPARKDAPDIQDIAARVVAVRENGAGVEMVVAVNGNRLLVRCGQAPQPPDVLRLNATVRLEIPPEAIHAFREYPS